MCLKEKLSSNLNSLNILMVKIISFIDKKSKSKAATFYTCSFTTNQFRKLMKLLK
ncbi:hypothetical protein SAMN05444366_1637 [Flavobacterium saccharophilum]|uniref:Uncharacterized protein n=1 Tax=Flavobacterium saccharophilum TaxID=29534 RepID=A0A1M7DNX6_9FLAO|nr:hypothetical protein SAMN05444366_1637 [Flavobacterium saccharophilum]